MKPVVYFLIILGALSGNALAFRDLETGTFLTRDPIGYGDGPNVYCYVHCNPITMFDPLGLNTLVIFGEDAGGKNPFGHIAMATTGSGILTSGTKHDMQSSVVQYLRDESERRDQALYMLETSAENEAEMVKTFLDGHNSGNEPVKNNCSDITGNALKAGGVIGPNAIDKFPRSIFNYMQTPSVRRVVLGAGVIKKDMTDEEIWAKLQETLVEFEPKVSQAASDNKRKADDVAGEATKNNDDEQEEPVTEDKVSA